jgi:hypothetical protein
VRAGGAPVREMAGRTAQVRQLSGAAAELRVEHVAKKMLVAEEGSLFVMGP